VTAAGPIERILHADRRRSGTRLRAPSCPDLKPGRQCIASANDLAVGRNVDEVLRVLDALQTGELCPYDWKAGEPTLQVA
jgi:hypothetical protein